MTIRRWIAVLLTIVVLAGCANAEEAVPEETMIPVYAPADMTAEEIQLFVEMLFAAVSGTSTEREKELRKDMTEEENDERNTANTEYRAKTLPWLMAVFKPEIPSEELMPVLDEYNNMLQPTPEPMGKTVEAPAYTTQDSYAAFSESETGREYLALMESLGGDSREKCLLITQEICGIWMAQVDHEELASMNEDYRCWIYSPKTQIDYPVVQSEDNSHYLKRLFNGTKNSTGTLFIDYRNLPRFQDPNTLIYGHHMRNDSMFGSLTDYADQAYYEGHPILLIMTADEVFLLEVFAGYTTSDKDHCYDIAISDEEDMAEFIDEAVRKSDFVSGVQVQMTDRLVTLSTCAYAFEDARYILIGRIVPVWNIEMDITTNADQKN